MSNFFLKAQIAWHDVGLFPRKQEGNGVLHACRLTRFKASLSFPQPTRLLHVKLFTLESIPTILSGVLPLVRLG